MFPQFETRRSRKIEAVPARHYLCLRRTSQDIPKDPGAYYEFTRNDLSREALQSIGAVCCRVTSARF